MAALSRISRFGRTYWGIGDLKKRANAVLDQPTELVSLMFDFANGYLRPFQHEGELADLVKEIRKLNPGAVLEIGTAKGGTLFLWTRLAQPTATIISIDLPGGKFGGGYRGWRSALYRRFPGRNQKLHLMRKDSHAQSTLDQTKRLFSGKQIDLLFIDGDHTYEGVKADWDMYSALVRPGGMAVFHDVAGNYADTQVKRLWDSLKPNFQHREIALDPNGLYGIGILCL